MWANLNKVCSFKKCNNSKSIRKLVINNKEVTEPHDISNGLNDFFTNIGDNLVKDLQKQNPLQQHNGFKNYCDPPLQNSMFCTPISKTELESLINKMKNGKSPGHDNIGVKMLKENVSVLSGPLSYIFNLSICIGKVPDKLKMAKIIPIYKNKGDPLFPGNYRPISLLSTFDKLLEKAMYFRLYNHLQANHVLYQYQFGFRKNYSTSLALIDVIDKIYHNINDGKLCTGVYLDLQKAFDTVNHDILLYKLYNYGVRGTVHNWFCSYLNNRQQYTRVADTDSFVTSVSCGVPQGSVLGPLLFLVYVNDIGNAVPSASVKLFADDTNLFIFGDSVYSVEREAVDFIYTLNEWFISNKLSLNLLKTCYMNFFVDSAAKNNLDVNGQIIEKVGSCKYLGILFDSELKWTLHIESIYKKLIKYCSIFYKLRDKLPIRMLKDIYYAFVHTHILYGIEIYANTKISYLDKLIKLNNKLLRILQHKPITTPVFELYKSYDTLPIPLLHKQQLLLFAHKFIHHPKLLPEVFINNKFFTFNEEIHNYETRTKTNIHLYHSNTTSGLRTIKHKAAVLWNELPPSIQNIKSISNFKKKIKMYLLTKEY